MCTHARLAAAAARAVLATAAGLALAVAFAVPAARAGEYHVYSCRTPSGGLAPTDGWSEAAHSGEDVTLDTCQEAGGGLIAGMDDGYVHSAHSATDKASWIFRAPVDESVASATLWRVGDTSGGSNQHAYYAAYMESATAMGEAESFDACTAWQPCTSEGNPSDPLASANRVVAPESVLPSAYVALDAACGSAIVEYGCPEGKNNPNGYAATIELFAADLVLSETESPTVSAVAGSLAEAPTVSGTSDVAFEASDSGSGIYEVVFKVDGAVVSTVVPEEEGGRCHDVGGTTDGLPAFLYTQPCPAALSVDLPFDTTALVDGTHDLLVSVLDAAGNSTTVLDRKITVANSATPAGGTGGSGSSGGGSNGNETSGDGSNGTGGTASGGSTPSGAATAVGAGSSLMTLGAANGTNASDQATLTATWRGRAGERLSGAYGAARTVEGRLTAPGGVPITDAQIEVGALPSYAGATAHALPTPRTGAAGRWSLVLPRGSSSEVLRVAYRSHLGAAAPVATRTLTLSVRAGIELSIAPHVASADGEIRFGGRLLGAPVPAGGKQLVLEARSPGGRWVEFHVIRGRSGAGGRFHFAYRFHLPGPVRYQFRVLCEAEADYPFAAGSSNIVGVYER
jgi:hypothetical protein